MAEISGLTLGAVALASLFSTCIDLFERFELGKNYRRDYELACTKMCLLQTRLTRCGRALCIDPTMMDVQGTTGLDPQERHAVGRTLSGIKEIFENATLHADKYFEPGPSSKTSSLLSPHLEIRQQSRFSVKDHCWEAARNLRRSSWRKRTTWAIYGKQKFSNFITELDFLIDHLENMSAGIPRTTTPNSAVTRDPPTKKLVKEAVQPPLSQTIDGRIPVHNENYDMARHEDEITASDHTNVHLGNVGSGPSSCYRTKIHSTGHAQIQLGNRDPKFELERIKLLLKFSAET